MFSNTLGFCDQRLKRIDSYFQTQYLDDRRLPGVHLIISRRGEIAHELVAGMQDIERAIPLPDDAIFRIYSMSKPITSVAALTLVEQGRLRLDDPVSQYIPEWTDMTVLPVEGAASVTIAPPEVQMRIVDLFRHTSGLTYDFQQSDVADEAYRARGIGKMHGDLDLRETVAALSDIPLSFAPASAWKYSISIDVLGHIIERVSGQHIAHFLQENIFSPLGMKDTAFMVNPEAIDRFTSCYRSVDGRLQLHDSSYGSDFLRTPTFFSGGGGLVSTARDYHKFATMLAQRGRLGDVRILSPKMVDLMGSNLLPGALEIGSLSRSNYSEAAYAGMGFGLGVAVISNNARTLMPCSNGEMHWGGMASTVFWADPQEQVSVTFMTQLVPSSAYPIRRELRTLVYSALMSDLSTLETDHGGLHV